MVEAFSLRGFGRLAKSWKENPPFAGDNAFGDANADYRATVMKRYAGLADDQGLTRDLAAWFADHHSEIERVKKAAGSAKSFEDEIFRPSKRAY